MYLGPSLSETIEVATPFLVISLTAAASVPTSIYLHQPVHTRHFPDVADQVSALNQLVVTFPLVQELIR